MLLVVSAKALVHGATQAATTVGVSERVIGLTLVAIGTSLPELATSVVASWRGHDDVAVGNVVGSNIFNVLGILGASAVVLPLPVDVTLRGADIPWMVGVSLAMGLAFWPGGGIPRWKGGVLLLAAIGYSVLLGTTAIGS